MELEQKAAQLFWITVHGPAGDTSHPANRRAYGVDTPAEVIRRHRPGGVVLFAWADNTQHPEQVARLTRELQEAAGTSGQRLGIAIDEEGGRVTRLGPPATGFPSARAVGVAADRDLALRRWRATGRELAALGVTTNLAPVVDLGNARNPVVGDRAFAEDVATVVAHGASAVQGLHEGGVAAVAKHFPGHGATEVDSHLALPVVELSRGDLEPHVEVFRQLVAARPPAGIMPGHLLVRALDPDRPATLSSAILAGLLRGQLGYEGAVVTDSLSMAGIRGARTDPQVAAAAVQAGADVLLTPPDLTGAVEAIVDAVRRGELSEGRLDEALRRAEALRTVGAGGQHAGVSAAAAGVGAPEHRLLASEIARRAVLVQGGAERLPLRSPRTVVIGVTGSGARGLADELARRGRAAALIEVPWQDEGAERLAAAGQEQAVSHVRPGGSIDLGDLAAGLRDADVVLVRRVPEVDLAAQERLLSPVVRGCEGPVIVETGGGAVPLERTDVCVVRSHDASAYGLEAIASVLTGEGPRRTGR
jgi:beta-N-acetylhexosaminidase